MFDRDSGNANHSRATQLVRFLYDWQRGSPKYVRPWWPGRGCQMNSDMRGLPWSECSDRHATQDCRPGHELIPCTHNMLDLVRSSNISQ